MKLSELPPNKLSFLLSAGGVRLKIGLFHVLLGTSIVPVTKHLCLHYSEFDVVNDDEFVDFNVTLAPPSLLRRFLRPQVNFSVDGYFPFKPLPYAQAPALFEWGLNWCIASYSNHYLIIHAAVVERNGQAFIFAGSPGSGKSTLCAALVCSGWRLLSDEMALLSLHDGLVYPVPRPVSLKNQSLAIIGKRYPNSVIGPVVNDTLKGSVGHMRPPDDSVRSAAIPAKATHLLFPKYRQGSATELSPLSKGSAFLKVAENCFNYHVLGVQGFHAVGELCDNSSCYEFYYSQLDEAVALFSELSA